MATHHFLLLSTLTILFTFSNGDTNLIRKTCNATKYYELCVSSLQSNTSSSQADTKGLAVIMVRIGITNATSTSSYLSSQVRLTSNGTTNDALMKRVLKECVNKYSYAGEALKSSLQNLSDELYDYAYLNVMAAADYPNACHNTFKRYPKFSYPKDLADREDEFKHICEVTMSIIDALGQ